VIEREQIDGVMLSSLMQEGLNDLLVCRQIANCFELLRPIK
jgi:hypothetical protein